ncbi:MAG: hypothetical protein WC455_10300 [Dehalococcoidia bacterium]|jgi:hypothetical protein
MKITKEGDEIVFRVPFMSDCHGDYGSDRVTHRRQTLIGVVDRENDEFGLAYTIDMSYAGKPDQYSCVVFSDFGSREELEEACERLGLDVVITS